MEIRKEKRQQSLGRFDDLKVGDTFRIPGEGADVYYMKIEPCSEDGAPRDAVYLTHTPGTICTCRGISVIALECEVCPK